MMKWMAVVAVTVGLGLAPAALEAQSNLPVQVQADLLQGEINEALKAGDFPKALQGMDGYRKLGIPVAPALMNLEARASVAAGDLVRAKRVFEQYFSGGGQQDSGYQEALSLYRQILPQAQAAEARAQAEAEAAAAKAKAEMEAKAVESGKVQMATGACEGCPDLVVIKPGSFLRPIWGKKPIPITVDKPYAIGRFEVTFAEWDACVAAKGCKSTPSDKNWGRGKRAVMNVSWSDVQEYLAWLSAVTHRRFRLPTVAEWELAAFAGVVGDHDFRDLYDPQPCLVGNAPDGTLMREGKLFQSSRYKCQDGFGSGPAPVGSFKANAWGLYDVHGNVWELVDACADTTVSAETRNASCEGKYVARGGAWDGDEADYGAGNWTVVSIASDKVGFRVAVDVE